MPVRVLRFFAPDRGKLEQVYGTDRMEFHRSVFLSGLGRFFAAMLIVVHLVVMFPGTSFLDTDTKLWLAPFVAGIVALMFGAAWLVEHGHHAASRLLTNGTIAVSTMGSVIFCGGFVASHATPFLIAPIVVAFCISPPREAVIWGTATFTIPLVLDLMLRSLGISLPDYTSQSSETANAIFLMGTLFITVSMSLTYLQRIYRELHETLTQSAKSIKHGQRRTR